MKTLFRSVLVWLPLAAALAQTPPRDLDPFIVAQSNPYPPRGYMGMLAVDNGLAVGALNSGWLAVVDVQDPARPRWRSAIPSAIAGHVSGLALSRGHLLATGSSQWPDAPTDQWELAVFDLVNPDRPTQVARVGLQEYCELKVAGSHGFLICHRHVEILDLSDLTHPKPVGRYDVTGSVADVAADGGIACIVEIRDPFELELHVVEVADQAHPRRLGGFLGRGNWNSQVLVGGQQAFLAHYGFDPPNATTYRDVVTILDLTDPAQPTRIAGLDLNGMDLFGGVDHLALSGRQLFISTMFGIYGVDVEKPNRPVVTRRLEFQETHSLPGFTVSGDTVYLSGDPGLQIYDATDPAGLRRVGGLVTTGHAWDVAGVGRYALLAEGASGLQIIDVADPNNARRVGEAATSGEAVAVEWRHGATAL